MVEMVAIAKQFLLCGVVMSVVSIPMLLALPRISRYASARSLFGALLALVIAFIIPLRLPIPMPFPTQVYQTPAEAQVVSATAPQVPAPTGGPTTFPEMPAGSLQTASPAWLSPLLSYLWLLGALFVWLLPILRHRRFMRVVLRWSEPVRDPQTLSIFRAEKQSLGLRREIALLRCPALTTPMLTGLLRPTILLPKNDFSAEDIRLILRHELIHYRRGDLPAKALAMLAKALHFYNPIIYFVANALTQQGELACDAAVVRGADIHVRKQYGTAILSIVRDQSSPRTALSTTFIGGKKSMKKRILSLLDTQRRRYGTLVLCAMLLVITLTGAALATNAAPTAYLEALSDEATRKASYGYVAEQFEPLADDIANGEITASDEEMLLELTFSELPDELNDTQYDQARELAAQNLLSACAVALDDTALRNALPQLQDIETSPYDAEITAQVQGALSSAPQDEAAQVRLLRAVYALTDYEQDKLTAAATALASGDGDIDATQEAYLTYVMSLAKLHQLAYALNAVEADVVVVKWGADIGQLLAVNEVYAGN